MSVSTDVEVSENTQQNEEQEVVTQSDNQDVVAQNENQEIVTQDPESTASDTANNNQANKFDLEKSKAKLEFISIAFALISVISTGLVKILSLGTHLQYSFDFNNYEFKLTNTDFIILFLSAFFCVLAIIFCYKTNKIRNIINNEITNCFKDKLKIGKLLKGLVWVVIYFSLALAYLILGLLIINLLCSLKGIAPFQYEIYTIFAFTFLFVFSLYCFSLVEVDGNKLTNKILCVSLFFIVVLGFIKISYEKAVNQREFEIIVTENDKGQSQEYVVISKGSSYSAYQCSTEEQEAEKVLIIHTDLHRYFPLDDTETRLTIFDEYQLYKYGQPLDTLDEDNNSDEYQTNEE